MKKMLVLTAIIAVLSIMFCGCGSATTVEEPVITEDESVITEDEISTEPVIEEPAVDVDWQTLTYQWTDDSGYTFEATVRVSPWINTKNEAYVNAAWDEVGQGNSLPSADTSSWGLERIGDSYDWSNDIYGYFRSIKNITDFYYCIGEISVKNLTEGWDITNQAPTTSNPLWFSACQPETDTKGVKNNPCLKDNHRISNTLSRVFFSNSRDTYPTWAVINPEYTSNQWGAVPFIFTHFDNKTPAAPEGEHISEIRDTYFCINSMNNSIWTKEMSELTTTKLSVVEE